jgi:uncharacterized protein YmfQ (DUF2313 family)
MALFERRDIEQYTNSLADYLPGGILFASKSVASSNFRKLLRGMAGELFRANGLLKEYSEEIIPDQTVKFIAEWESTLGIPDDCFKVAGTIDNRRKQVLTKLAALGVQTIPDFENVALIFGVTATVLAGSESGITFASNKVARFTIVINLTLPERFTYTFPLTFGDDVTVLLECLFNKLKPANCQVLFQEI